MLLQETCQVVDHISISFCGLESDSSGDFLHLGKREVQRQRRLNQKVAITSIGDKGTIKVLSEIYEGLLRLLVREQDLRTEEDSEYVLPAIY